MSKAWPQLCESLSVCSAQILGYLLPREEDEEDNFPSRTRRRQTVSAVETSVATLLDTNTVIQQSLVRTAFPATAGTRGAVVDITPETQKICQRADDCVGQVTNLLQLFVEIERTGRHNQFYEKFEVRQDIGRILSRLVHIQTSVTCFCRSL